MNRREFNKSLLTMTGLGAGAAMGALPLSVLAAWPAAAFDVETVEGVAPALYGADSVEASDAITIKAPDIAENGAVVPVSITSSIPGTDAVSLLVAGNPSPLAATFELANAGTTKVSTRIKMGKSSELVALVRANGKVYTATSSEVKVTIGGCGG